MKTLRFNGRPGDVLLAAGERVEAGCTQDFNEEDAERLLTDPNVDVSEVCNDLNKLKVDELEQLATELGVSDPRKIKPKADLVAAIESKQADAEPGDGENTQSEAGDGAGLDDEGEVS